MTTHNHFQSYSSPKRISFLLAAILLTGLSFSQEENKQEDPPPLKELHGFTQTFYYSPGHEARAKDIAVFLEDAGNYFEEEINFTPQIELYILAPVHWKDIAVAPVKDVYGFPHNIDMVRLAVASEDNDFWRSFLPPVENLPAHVAKQVKKAYSKPDGTYSMMPFFDLLALHEMGHSYTAQAGLKMHRKWMGELFVNLMLHTYVAEEKPELLPALETFPNMVIGGGTAEYKYRKLEDFERLYATMGMGPKNYGWYQSKLHSAAKDIYNAGGKDVMKRLWDALKIHQQDMTNEEFANMLKEEVHPSVGNVYLNWDAKD